jgi:NDP-sugar pyrophosphorylase family protein
MIRRIVRRLAAAAVTDLVLNLHHLPHTVSAVVGDGSDMGARVRYSWEQPLVLGSAGGTRRASRLLDASPFFVVNGDTLTDVDLSALAADHAASGALVTLALVPNRAPERYGGLRLADDGGVTAFVPRGETARGSYHFIGVQVAHRAAFHDVPDARPSSTIGGFYDQLVDSQPGSIRGYVCDAAFWDVGTLDDYRATSFAWLGGRPVESTYGRGTRIDGTARVDRSIVWDDVEIGPGCTIEDCILTDGVRLPAGAVYRHSVLRRGERGLVVTAYPPDPFP